MNSRHCINLAGLVKHEKTLFSRLARMKEASVLEIVNDYSKFERQKYCSRCPVSQRCKFEARYKNWGK